MAKYSTWVKKAEAPDVENYYAFTGKRQAKAAQNLCLCLIMFLVHICSGFINPPSSHSFLVFLPYVFNFIPFAYIFFASVRLFFLPESVSRKQWDKSFGTLKHAGTGLIITSGICLVCELVFIFMNLASLKASPFLRTELLFCGLQGVLLASAVLYGFYYDKKFSGR